MKLITLEDVNNAILGTDIKILDYINIIELNNINSLCCYGVYVLNYNHKKSYIGMSSLNKGFLRSRLSAYIREVHQRNLIESIDVFITNSYHAQVLEKIMIKTFKPELNSNKFEHLNCDDFDNIKTIDNKITLLEKELKLVIEHDIVKRNNDRCNIKNKTKIPIPIISSNEHWKLKWQIERLKMKKYLIIKFEF